MSKDLIICASAGPDIGIGHVMRCLTLSLVWQELNPFGSVLFIGSFPESICQAVQRNNCSVHQLSNVATADEIVSCAIDTANNTGNVWVILDGYIFNWGHYRKVRKSGLKLMVIDDYMHSIRYEADIVLNQNPYAPNLNYKIQPGCRLLTGLDYVLLRNEFKRTAKTNKHYNHVPNILVTMGGADKQNVTLRILSILNKISEQLSVTFVLGPANPNCDTLKKALYNFSHRYTLIEAEQDMASLMKQMDLTITAAGSTCWELCCLGIPFVTVVIAENQHDIAFWLEKEGIAPFLGYGDRLEPDKSAQILKKLIKAPEALIKQSQSEMKLIDGLGAERIVKILMEKEPVLRKAESRDCEMIWDWSNDPVVRAASFNSTPIPWDSHEKWYMEKLDDPKYSFLVAMDGPKEVLGMVRFSISKDKAIISIALAPDKRRLGWGSKIIRAGINKISREKDIRQITAFIKRKNIRSIEAFKRAGFFLKNTNKMDADTLQMVCGN